MDGLHGMQAQVEFHYALEIESGWRCFVFCVRWAFYYFPFAVYMSESLHYLKARKSP